MYLAYYDESGDDGYPQYAAPLFVLSAVYLHESDWRSAFDAIREFRRNLKDSYGIPVKTEIHTKQLVLNKKPYRRLGLSDSQRLEVISAICRLIEFLPISVVNVTIDKPKIPNPRGGNVRPYKVLDRALTYSLQRIENDLSRNAKGNMFFMITDEGRVGKMRTTARAIRAFNYIPSMFTSASYRRDIKLLIEDPIPKRSNESYFIQLSDTIAYIVYNHKLLQLGRGQLHNRTPSQVTATTFKDWLDMMGESLNKKASSSDPYGIVTYPN
ncbi:MAG: DUF3800 domain-containing protein [Bacteroidota bacterium]